MKWYLIRIKLGTRAFLRLLITSLRINDISQITEVREAGTPHPRKKIKTYLGIMDFLWALEWRNK